MDITDGLEKQRNQLGQLDLVELFLVSRERYIKRYTSCGARRHEDMLNTQFSATDTPCCFMSVQGKKYNTNNDDRTIKEQLPLVGFGLSRSTIKICY